MLTPKLREHAARFGVNDQKCNSEFVLLQMKCLQSIAVNEEFVKHMKTKRKQSTENKLEAAHIFEK